MNAGFEDCTVLDGLIQRHDHDWTAILENYDNLRKPNGDAVARLALLNFVEMRDKVSDPVFLERKKIEKELGRLYPDQFVSIYEMVSFSHIPYHTAISCIKAQDVLLGSIMAAGNFADNIDREDFRKDMDSWVQQYYHAVQQLDFGNEV
jgi:kynurenine 3-monooxygenase